MSIDIEKFSVLTLLYTSKRAIKRTSLNKLLFFSDVFHLIQYNQVITAAKYYKMPYGPVPEYIDEVRRFLIEKNFLTEEETVEYSNFVYNYRSTLDANQYRFFIDNFFDEKERETIKLVSCNLIHWNASDLSRKSHEFEPWKSANWNEELDLTKCQNDNKLLEWANTIIKQ
ncbi:MAG: SocA family protein [Ignavibacteria bacterium]|nr:SocA family protein [Ignavibacteria bacterium]